MAVLSTKGLSGQLGKQFVFKATKSKTVVSAYVAPRKRKPTELQQLFRDCFKRAQKRASKDSRDKEIKAICAPYLKEGQSVYHFLMGLYQREEVKMLKECRKESKTLEELLREEPKKRKEMLRQDSSKKTNNKTTIWAYPIKKRTAPKADPIPKMDVVISRPFYGGWVSTYSG
jgi:hypothetical protein